MPAKPKPPKERKYYFATHRVNAQFDWQACAFNDATGERTWVPCTYEDVPDHLWSQHFRRDGWRFYSDHTRECDERGFPVGVPA